MPSSHRQGKPARKQERGRDEQRDASREQHRDQTRDADDGAPAGGRHMSSLKDFDIGGIDGSGNPLPDLDGKVVLLVNVASQCGLTPQYAGLQSLHNELKEQGFAVLGLPCNQFGAQEPGAEDEIAQFCETNYGVEFPLTEKIEVNGPGRHPLYTWLTGAFPGDVEWNFEKFLVDRAGRVVRRYPPATPPDDKGLLQDIAGFL
jgi:glutathione peroxidase